MTSQHGWQTITVHILPNISQSKDNQTVKLGQLIEFIEWNIFLQKLCAAILAPDLFLFFKKA